MSGFSLLSRLCPVLDYTVAFFSLLSGLKQFSWSGKVMRWLNKRWDWNNQQEMTAMTLDCSTAAPSMQHHRPPTNQRPISSSCDHSQPIRGQHAASSPTGANHELHLAFGQVISVNGTCHFYYWTFFLCSDLFEKRSKGLNRGHSSSPAPPLPSQ